MYSGHHAEYPQHIINHSQKYLGLNLFLLLHSKSALILDGASEKVEVIRIEEETSNNFENIKSPIKRAESELKYAVNIALDKKVDHLIFLDIDRYQLALAQGKNAGINFSGILFRPYVRLERENIIGKVKTFLTKKRKKIALDLLVRNNSLQKIYILNDDEVVSILNRNHKTSKFSYIPDPVNFDDINTLTTTNPSPSKASLKLLVIGSLDKRKNIQNILAALEQWDGKQELELTLIGLTNPKDYLLELNDIISKFQSDKVNVIFQNEYISKDEMFEAFSNTDIIMIPYKDFFYSSGILGYAALFNKPVIASKQGTVGKLVPEYKLGLTVNPHLAKAILNAIKLLSKKSFVIDGKKYLEDHRTDSFVSTLLRA